MNRRDFLRFSTAAAAMAMAGPCDAAWSFIGPSSKNAGPEDVRGRIFKGDAPATLWKWSHEAFLYKKLGNQKVVCGICPNRCVLSPGDRSVCRSKVNLDGTLYSLTYGNPSAIHNDPVEKKPLFHFLPQSRVFSLATTGCNFRCLNCQNWQISQAKPHEVRHHELFPPDAVAAAQKAQSLSIAYTYSEAITYFEYMIATARLARAHGIKNLWISNGFINKAPLIELCKVLDGANVNLKSFDDSTYRKLNGGRLKPVLDTFQTLDAQGVHFEMTTLVVPGYVDDQEMLKRMCAWILSHLGPDHPLHFLRFFPQYKLDRLAPTPISTLTRFRKIAMQAGIRYVYVGNVPVHEGRHTYCHNCDQLLVERQGYHIAAYNLTGNRCKFCDTVIPGVWI